MHTIEVNNLTKHYGNHAAVDHATRLVTQLHIYAKLDVNDRAAAVATAFERGLLEPRDQG